MFNCDNDDDSEINHQTTTIKTTALNFSQIESNTNVIKEIEKINEFSNSIINRDGENNDGFYIPMNYVNYMENENYHSYTFDIIRYNPQDNHLENLLLSVNIDGGYDAFIVKYESEETENITATLTPIDFDSDTLFGRQSSRRYLYYECNTVWDPPCTLSGTHNSNCSTGEMVTECAWVEFSGGGGVGDDDTSSGGDGSEGGGGVPSDPNDPNDLIDGHITTPTVSYDQQIINCLGSPTIEDRRSFNYHLWLDNAEYEDEINMATYLSNSDCSNEAVEFGYIIAEILYENEDLDFEIVFRLIDGFDKRCQGQIVLETIKIESELGNLIENNLFNNLDYSIGFQDARDPNSVQYSLNSYNEGNISVDNIIVVNLNEDYLNSSTDLGIVSSLSHELVHAYIFYLYHSNLLLTVYPSYTDLNTALNNYYDLSTSENFDIAEVEMHDIFGDFIEMMTDFIFNYASANDIEDVDLEYAKNLAWGSLYGYEIFETYPNHELAELLIAYEHSNHENAKSSKSCE